MSSSTFKSHFNMISMNESVQHKAKFWTSYVRALKGTEDMRANDDNTFASRRRQQRGGTEVPEYFHSFFNDLPAPYVEDASSRIFAPGYKYMPVSRETYGSAPRAHGSTSMSATPRAKSVSRK